jgi:hypothetical protein
VYSSDLVANNKQYYTCVPIGGKPVAEQEGVVSRSYIPSVLAPLVNELTLTACSA